MCIRICITVPFRLHSLESLGCAGPPSPNVKYSDFMTKPKTGVFIKSSSS
uniref:Uncharacterized protein n=1 Tax=Anguilla anguilla TaxID=7936 RepID=A0A0E9RU72_ANGAN